VQHSQCEEAEENMFHGGMVQLYQSMPEASKRKGVLKQNQHHRTPTNKKTTTATKKQNKTKNVLLYVVS